MSAVNLAIADASCLYTKHPSNPPLYTYSDAVSPGIPRRASISPEETALSYSTLAAEFTLKTMAGVLLPMVAVAAAVETLAPASATYVPKEPAPYSDTNAATMSSAPLTGVIGPDPLGSATEDAIESTNSLSSASVASAEGRYCQVSYPLTKTLPS